MDDRVGRACERGATDVDDEDAAEVRALSSNIISDMYTLDLTPRAMQGMASYIIANDVLRFDKISRELKAFRDRYSIDSIRKLVNDKRPSYSCAVLAFGGLICSIASVIAGFKQVWGTETCPDKQRLWKSLFSDSPIYPDTFTDIPNNVRRVTYMTSGFPCPDYSPRGSNLGSKGETGWMYVRQVDIILRILPVAIRLEQSDNALYINDKRDVQTV